MQGRIIQFMMKFKSVYHATLVLFIFIFVSCIDLVDSPYPQLKSKTNPHNFGISTYSSYYLGNKWQGIYYLEPEINTLQFKWLNNNLCIRQQTLYRFWRNRWNLFKWFIEFWTRTSAKRTIKTKWDNDSFYYYSS